MVYETNTLIPVKISYPALWTLAYDPNENDIALKENLDLRAKLRQKQGFAWESSHSEPPLLMIEEWNKKIYKQEACPLLGQNWLGGTQDMGYWDQIGMDLTNQYGPYLVTKKLIDRVYELTSSKRKKLPRNYHSNDLTPYFA